MKTIKAIIHFKNNFIDEDQLVLIPDDETKSHYKLKRRKDKIGLIPSDYIKINDKGKRYVELYSPDGYKYAFMKRGEKGDEYAVADLSQYSSSRVQDFNKGVDETSLLAKNLPYILIAMAMVFFMIGSFLFMRGAREYSSAIMSLVQPVTDISKALLGNPPL